MVEIFVSVELPVEAACYGFWILARTLWLCVAHLNGGLGCKERPSWIVYVGCISNRRKAGFARCAAGQCGDVLVPHPPSLKGSHKTESADIEATYRRYGDLVFRRCMRFLGNSDDCRDIVQDVFVRYTRNASAVRREARAAWLLQVADRLCLDLIRKRQTRSRLLRIFGVRESVVQPDYQDVFAHRQLLALIARESNSLRELLTRYYVHGESLSRIGEDLDLNPRTARRMHQNFVKKAQKQMGQARGDKEPGP